MPARETPSVSLMRLLYVYLIMINNARNDAFLVNKEAGEWRMTAPVDPDGAGLLPTKPRLNPETYLPFLKRYLKKSPSHPCRACAERCGQAKMTASVDRK